MDSSALAGVVRRFWERIKDGDRVSDETVISEENLREAMERMKQVLLGETTGGTATDTMGDVADAS